MKRTIYLLPFLLVFGVSAVSAQSESQRVAEQIAPLLNENVAAVGHIDLAKIDLEKLDSELRPVLQKDSLGLFLSLWLFRGENRFDEAKQAIQSEVQTLRNTFGVRDIYFLAIPSLLPRSFGVLAIPFADPAKAEALKKSPFVCCFSSDGEPAGKVFGRFLIVPVPGINTLKDTSNEGLFQQIESQAPTARPEFLAALEAVEGSAIQFAAIPSEEMRRVFTEMDETLPPPLESLSPVVLTRGVRWAVLGVDLEKHELRFVVQSEQARAANDLREKSEIVLEDFFARIKDDVAYTTFLETAKIDPEKFRDLSKAFLPQVEGDRLSLTIDESFVKEKGVSVFQVPTGLADLAQSESRRMQCSNNLKMICLSFHNYHDANKGLPPLYTSDKDGKPLHSWRVAVLPYLYEKECVGLYEKIRKDEPWDSEYNRQFHTQCPKVYQCPEIAAKNPDVVKNGLTTYSLIVGKNAYPQGPEKQSFAKITDGTSQTIQAVERATPVCWMDPTNEITQENAEKGIGKVAAGIAAPHSAGKRYGANFSLFDGSVHFFAENMRPKCLKGIVERNDGAGMCDSKDMYEDE